MRALATAVLGDSARPVRGLLFDKHHEHNWAVTWHQDTVIAVAAKPSQPLDGFGSWSTKGGVPHVRPPREILEGMLAVRLSLDDVDLASGTLRIVPGSHRRGVLDARTIESMRAGASVVACEAGAAGDALLMRPLLLHSSPKASGPAARNTDAATGRRRVVHIEFAGVDLPPPLVWAGQ